MTWSICHETHDLLNKFKPYTPKQNAIVAYEVKESDRTIPSLDDSFGFLETEKGSIKFIRNAEFVSYQVFAGDFIEIIKWPDVAVHWPREKFLARTVTENYTVIQRGDAVLEELCAGSLRVSSHVIKIKDRYFVGIEKGRVMTAWSIEGATKFRPHDDAKKLEKTLAELTARKKSARVLEVGYWSREFAAVQGGAA